MTDDTRSTDTPPSHEETTRAAVTALSAQDIPLDFGGVTPPEASLRPVAGEENTPNGQGWVAFRLFWGGQPTTTVVSVLISSLEG